MPLYKYQGRDEQGRASNGQIKASSTQHAASQLKEFGITPISIDEVSEGRPWREYLLQLGLLTVTNEELNTFCRQMHALLEASIPLNKAIRKVIDGTRNELLRGALFEINKNINAGQSLSKSMAEYPSIFSNIFINTVAAGESGGKLEDAFNEMGRFLSFETKAQKRLKSALRYPIIVILVLISALIVLSVFVIPQFTQLFNALNTQLPLPTRMIINTSMFITNNGFYLLIGFVVAILSLRLYFSTENGRYRLHKWIIKMPIFGTIIYRIIISRFARIFTILYRAGVPLNKALHLTSKALNNDYISEKVVDVVQQINRGESLSNATISSGLLPPLGVQMLQSGEESGMLENMLDYVAKYYEEEVDYDLSRIEDLMTPIIILILGVLVLIMALGVFLPIWNAIAQLGG